MELVWNRLLTNIGKTMEIAYKPGNRKCFDEMDFEKSYQIIIKIDKIERKFI